MTFAGIEAKLRATKGRLEINADFRIDAGTLVIAGPNGAGKSSLLALLLGVLPVSDGYIHIANTTLLDTKQQLTVPVEQRKLAYVPQHYALLPHLNVRKQVEFALRCSGERAPEALLQAETDNTLRAFELVHLASQLPQQLSGGEKQRVALARALCVKPRALLLDEPLAAMDIVARRKLRAHLRDTLKTLALPTVLVTHDPVDAELLADQVLILEAGSVTQFGTWPQLRARPATSFIREFVGAEDTPPSPSA